MTGDKSKCHDIAVIGAGPGGCSAALALSQAGFDVVLLEKAALPRYKTCGGGILGRAYKLLPKSVDRVVERKFDAVQLNFLGTQLSFTATRNAPMVYMTMRASLDDLLASEAQTAGTRVIDGCTVKSVATENDGVHISTDKGDFRSKFVIAADGVHSTTAKAIGWSALPLLAPALEWEVHLPATEFARFQAIPRFDFNTIDAGYAWVFPKRDHLSIGILSTHRVSTDLQVKLQAYMDNLGLTQIDKIEKHGYLIPLAPRREPLARGRVLLIGDAAGLVDPVTAEGISHAIKSGLLAATALIESHLDVSKAAHAYQSLLEEHILRDLRAARFLSNFLYHHPRIRHLAFQWQGQRLSDFVADVVMGDQTYLGAFKKPSSYLKMLGLAGRK